MKWKRDFHFEAVPLRIWNPLYTLLTNPFTRPSLPAQLFVCNGFSYSYLSPATNLKSAHQPIARWLTHKPFEVGIMCKISFPARLPILTRKEVGGTYSPIYGQLKLSWYFVVFCTCYWAQIRNGRVFEQTDGIANIYILSPILSNSWKMAAKEEKRKPFKNI